MKGQEQAATSPLAFRRIGFEMSTGRFRFGEFTMDLGRASLQRGGSAISLRPKSFALLEYLVKHAGRLVSKEELLAAVWSGLVVTEDSLTRCISEIRAALGDGAQEMIRTVSRRGYLFAELVTPLDGADPPLRAASDVSTEAARTRKKRQQASWLALLGVVLTAVAAWFLAPGSGPVDAPRLTLVVLPFANLGEDASQAYLAHIVTEDLTIALTRLHGATVIAPSTAMAFRGKPADLISIGAELGVRYALEGGVLRAGDRLRINATLTDIARSRRLWSDQFDVDRGDLLQTQDDIVMRLFNALDPELVMADGRRSARATGTRLDAEDLAMQCDAAAVLQQGGSSAASYELCEQALRLDPGNVRALVRLASYFGERVDRVQSPDPAADLARAKGLAAKALELDPHFYGAHCAHAVVLSGEHRVRDALAAAERCLALNPSHARAYRILATLHFFLAEPDQTLAYAERGMRLSPRDSQMTSFLLFKGWGYFMKGQDQEALLWLRKAAAASPENTSVLAPLVSALALSNHDEDARSTLVRYLSLKGTRSRTIAQWSHLPDSNEAFLRFDERFKTGLRKAGMPEN